MPIPDILLRPRVPALSESDIEQLARQFDQAEDELAKHYPSLPDRYRAFFRRSLDIRLYDLRSIAQRIGAAPPDTYVRVTLHDAATDRELAAITIGDQDLIVSGERT